MEHSSDHAIFKNGQKLLKLWRRSPQPQMELQAMQKGSPNSLDYMFECGLNKFLSSTVCRNEKSFSYSNLKPKKPYQKIPTFCKDYFQLAHFSIYLVQVWKATSPVASKWGHQYLLEILIVRGKGWYCEAGILHETDTLHYYHENLLPAIGELHKKWSKDLEKFTLKRYGIKK